MTKGKGRCKGGPPAQAPVMPRPRASSPVDEETLLWMTGGSGNNATSSAIETRVNGGRCDVQAIVQPVTESSDSYDITENVEVSDASSVSSVTLLDKVDEHRELPTTDNSPTRDTERVILYDIIDGCTKCKQPCSLAQDESVIICGRCMNRIHAHCFLQIPDSCCPMCNTKVFAEGVITPAEFKESTKEFRNEIEVVKKAHNDMTSVFTKKVKTLQADLDVRTQLAQKCVVRDAALANDNVVVVQDSSVAVARRNYIIAFLSAIIACEMLHDIYEDAFIVVLREFVVSCLTCYSANFITWYSSNLKRNLCIFLAILGTVVWTCPSIFENIQRSMAFDVSQVITDVSFIIGDMNPITTTTTTTTTIATHTISTGTTLFHIHHFYNFDKNPTTTTTSTTAAMPLMEGRTYWELYVLFGLMWSIPVYVFIQHYLPENLRVKAIVWRIFNILYKLVEWYGCGILGKHNRSKEVAQNKGSKFQNKHVKVLMVRKTEFDAQMSKKSKKKKNHQPSASSTESILPAALNYMSNIFCLCRNKIKTFYNDRRRVVVSPAKCKSVEEPPVAEGSKTFKIKKKKKQSSLGWIHQQLKALPAALKYMSNLFYFCRNKILPAALKYMSNMFYFCRNKILPVALNYMSNIFCFCRDKIKQLYNNKQQAVALPTKDESVEEPLVSEGNKKSKSKKKKKQSSLGWTHQQLTTLQTSSVYLMKLCPFCSKRNKRTKK